MAAALQHEDAEVLSKSPMLRAIGPDLRQRFLDTVTIEEFEKRHPLFREGDPARAFYFVVRGWVQLSRIDATGKEAAVGLFGPGESFGEAAMFLGNKYPVDAHVVEAARLARVDSDRMMKLLETNSGLCFAMLGSMSGVRPVPPLVEARTASAVWPSGQGLREAQLPFGSRRLRRASSPRSIARLTSASKPW